MIQIIKTALPTVTYMIFSYEKGESGTPHLQGYLQLDGKHRKKIKAMRNVFKNKLQGWVEASRGSLEDNIKYVSKDPIAGPWEYGTSRKSTGGTRTDLTACTNDILSGLGLKAIVRKHPNVAIKYLNNISKMSTLLDDRVRDYRTELYIIVGVPGSGKSYTAKQEATQYLLDNNINETPYYLSLPEKGQPLWWPGYNGQKVVIINDFYGVGMSLTYFKNLIDEYGVTVNIKNAEAQFLAKRVYITSNAGWRTWWAADLLSNKHNEAAIKRRITNEREFVDVYVEPSSNNSSSSSAPVRTGAIVRESSFIRRVNEEARVAQEFMFNDDDAHQLDLAMTAYAPGFFDGDGNQ